MKYVLNKSDHVLLHKTWILIQCNQIVFKSSFDWY